MSSRVAVAARSNRNTRSPAVDSLRHHCDRNDKAVPFQLFERHDLDRLGSDRKISYDELAREFGISTQTVTNYLAYARREFRRIVLDKIREMTATDEEFRHEVRVILGIDVP